MVLRAAVEIDGGPVVDAERQTLFQPEVKPEADCRVVARCSIAFQVAGCRAEIA
jgi:hypothetical protein